MKEFEFTFGRDRSEQLTTLLIVLQKPFPQIADGLMEVVREARAGVRLSLEALQHAQTNPQRGYYHMWKNAFADFCGTTPDEMHEHLLCEAYGSETHHTKIGLMKRPLQRSSEANRVEYSLLIDTLIRVAADMGFAVPPPQPMENDT